MQERSTSSRVSRVCFSWPRCGNGGQGPRGQGTYYPRQDGLRPEVYKKELWDRSSWPELICVLLSPLPQ